MERPLYPQKRTSVTRQIFGLKKRTSDDRFAPDNRHSKFDVRFSADIGARSGEASLLTKTLYRVQGRPYMGFRRSEAPARAREGEMPIGGVLTGLAGNE